MNKQKNRIANKQCGFVLLKIIYARGGVLYVRRDGGDVRASARNAYAH